MVQFLIHNLISKSTVNVSTFAGKLYCVVQGPSITVPVIPLARASLSQCGMAHGGTNLPITILISNSCLATPRSVPNLKIEELSLTITNLFDGYIPT